MTTEDVVGKRKPRRRWIDQVEMCKECEGTTFAGNCDVRFRKCMHCGRIGCEDLVTWGRQGAECIPEADADSCMEFVDEEAQP